MTYSQCLFLPSFLAGEPGRPKAGRFLFVPPSSVEICVAPIPSTLSKSCGVGGRVVCHGADRAFGAAAGAVREGAPEQPGYPPLAWQGWRSACQRR